MKKEGGRIILKQINKLEISNINDIQQTTDSKSSKNTQKDKNQHHTDTHTQRNVMFKLVKTKVRGNLESRQKNTLLHNTLYAEK